MFNTDRSIFNIRDDPKGLQLLGLNELILSDGASKVRYRQSRRCHDALSTRPSRLLSLQPPSGIITICLLRSPSGRLEHHFFLSPESQCLNPLGAQQLQHSRQTTCVSNSQGVCCAYSRLVLHPTSNMHKSFCLAFEI